MGAHAKGGVGGLRSETSEGLNGVQVQSDAKTAERRAVEDVGERCGAMRACEAKAV